MYDETDDRLRDDDDAFEGRALVAAFATRDDAHEAARALRDEGFHNIWVGATRPSDTLRDEATGNVTAAGRSSAGVVVESDDDSLGAKIGRFFSGESGDRSLADALTRHGVAPSEARRIETSIAPNSAILTVDGSNHPELAAQIIERCGGHVLAGEYFGGEGLTGATTATTAGAREDLRGSEVLGYASPETRARGREIDEQRRLQLREERLNIGRQRESVGEAVIGKEVVEQRESIDVPVVREELFVERRAVREGETGVTGTTTGEIGAISESETIRIPLMRERVVVTKRPVVTEEVVVGKRQVTDTEHVEDTTRRERLRLDDPTGTVRGDTATVADMADTSTTGESRSRL